MNDHVGRYILIPFILLQVNILLCAETKPVILALSDVQKAGNITGKDWMQLGLRSHILADLVSQYNCCVLNRTYLPQTAFRQEQLQGISTFTTPQNGLKSPTSWMERTCCTLGSACRSSTRWTEQKIRTAVMEKVNCETIKTFQSYRVPFDIVTESGKK